MTLEAEIAACRICEAALGFEPRPVATFSSTASLLIIGQAPGSRVHASGIPWDDPSGDRLREWTGLDKATMYDPARVALVPMGFCYPGKGKSGDLPPRPECAPQWHARVLAQLPPDRLTLLVGSYAQAHYLPDSRKLSLTERVRHFAAYMPEAIPLPHPSWRSTLFMRRNPWFEAEVLPVLRERVAAALRRYGTHGTRS